MSQAPRPKLHFEHSMSLWNVPLLFLCIMSKLGVLFMHEIEDLVILDSEKGEMMLSLANEMLKFSVFA